MSDRNLNISDELMRFIFDCIDSVEQLDVLLLIHAHPDREWTFPEISRELRSSEASIRKRIVTLKEKSIIDPSALSPRGVRYMPFSEKVGQLVNNLSAIYPVQPYRVMELIFNKEKSAIQSFADSFRLKKEKE